MDSNQPKKIIVCGAFLCICEEFLKLKQAREKRIAKQRRWWMISYNKSLYRRDGIVIMKYRHGHPLRTQNKAQVLKHLPPVSEYAGCTHWISHRKSYIGNAKAEIVSFYTAGAFFNNNNNNTRAHSHRKRSETEFSYVIVPDVRIEEESLKRMEFCNYDIIIMCRRAGNCRASLFFEGGDAERQKSYSIIWRESDRGRDRARRARSVSAEEAGRVRCRLTLPLLRLLTSGCVSDAVSGPSTGRNRRGRSSIYTAHAAAVPRPRVHGVTVYYNDVLTTDAATSAAQPPTTPSTAAGTAVDAATAATAAAVATAVAAPDCSPGDDRRPRWRLNIHSPIGRLPSLIVRRTKRFCSTIALLLLLLLFTIKHRVRTSSRLYFVYRTTTGIADGLNGRAQRYGGGDGTPSPARGCPAQSDTDDAAAAVRRPADDRLASASAAPSAAPGLDHHRL
ncbi:hypothetical protein QTP88_015832 [Uroleucon formosanum]